MKGNNEPNKFVRLTKIDFSKREIYVEHGEDKYQLFVDPDLDIKSQVKEPIAKHLRVLADDIHIFYTGTDKEFDDEYSFRHYGMQGGGFFTMTRGAELPPISSKMKRNGSNPSLSDDLPLAGGGKRNSDPLSSQTYHVPKNRYVMQKSTPDWRNDVEKSKNEMNKADSDIRALLLAKKAAKKMKKKADERKAKKTKQPQDDKEAKASVAKAEEEERKRTEEKAAAAKEQKRKEKEATEAAATAKAEEERKRAEEKAAAAKEQKRKEKEAAAAAAKAEEERKQAEEERRRQEQEEAEARRKQQQQKEEEERLARQMPVTVKTLDGRQIKVIVDPSDSIDDIKKKVEQESGIPVKNQNLSMVGKELLDAKKTASSYGIKAGSVLDLEPKVITVVVCTPNGKRLNLQVSPSDSAETIKQKIEKETGMSVPQQVLKFKGKEVLNDKTVKTAGIIDGSELSVEIMKVPVTVNTSDGKRIQVMVDPTQTVSEIKDQLAKEAGIPANNQKLSMGGQELSDANKTAASYGIKGGSVLDLEPKAMNIIVRTGDGKRVNLQVSPSDSAETIKQKIEKETGMSVPQQVLKFKGREVLNGKTVKAAGITDGSELTVEIMKVPVTVNTMDGKRIKIMVDPTQTVSEIKDQLAKEAGIPATNQKLSMGGQEFLDPKAKAADCGIRAGAVLDLEPKVITVVVSTPAGKKVKVQVKSSDSVKTIKQKIEQETGMSVSQQVLKSKGSELLDGKTVKDAGIHDGSELTVEIMKVAVTVKTLDGTQLKIMVDPSDKISYIKQQIAQETGVSASNQKLSMGGKELSDPSKTAADCGIKAGSVLNMEPDTMAISVQTPDGKVHSIAVKSSDTADDIKSKISKASNLSASKQVLKFNGKELPNGKSVRDVGIQDGSQLVVEAVKSPAAASATKVDGKKAAASKGSTPQDRIAELKRQREAAKAAAADQSAAQSKPKVKAPPASVKCKKDDEPKKVLTEDKKRKCFMAYARLAQPNRDKMIQMIKKLDGGEWDITEEDVRALPWIANGAMLSVKEMNALFMTG